MGLFSKQVSDKDLFNAFIETAGFVHLMYTKTLKKEFKKDTEEGFIFWEKFAWILEGKTHDNISAVGFKASPEQEKVVQLASELVRDSLFDKEENNIKDFVIRLSELKDQNNNMAFGPDEYKDPAIQKLRKALSMYGCIFYQD